jgi:SAM-dependent methyltransferase
MYEAEKRVRRYERLYGQRVLRPLLAPVFKVTPEPEAGGIWLDWEAGPGILALELVSRMPREGTLLISEQDRASLRVLHSHHELEHDPRVFVRQDAPEEITLFDGVVDVAVGHWRWQYTAHPERATRELRRVVKPGGKIVLSFLQPGGGGTIHKALEDAGSSDLARALKDDGLTTSAVRECLRLDGIKSIEVRSFQFQVVVGQSSRPMMDPLLLDFLLPRWMGRATGQEVTSVDDETNIDLGHDPLSWDFKVGVALATVAGGDAQDDAPKSEPDTTKTPLPRTMPS